MRTFTSNIQKETFENCFFSTSTLVICKFGGKKILAIKKILKKTFYLMGFSHNFFFWYVVENEVMQKCPLPCQNCYCIKSYELLKIQIIHLCTLTALQCTDFFSADSSVFWPFIESLQNCFKTELNCKNVSFLDNRNILRLFINIFGTFLGSQKSFFMRESL